MATFLSSLIFEWRYFIRQPSFIIMSLLFFVVSFLATSIEQVQVGSSANQSLNLNSPYLITQMLLIFNVFGLFLVVNFVANTALRANLSGMYELIYTKHTPQSYFLGSFFGSYLTVLSVFAFVPLGVLLGSVMPWLNAERLGEFNLLHYWQPFFVYVVPTLLSLSCLLYAAALKFKSMMAVYLTALVVVVIYLTLDNLLSNPDFGTLIAILDPFALNSFADETRYWTPVERNTLLTGHTFEMALNRTLWIGTGFLVLYLCKYKWGYLNSFALPSARKKGSSGYTPIIKWHSKSRGEKNRIQQYMMRVVFETRLLVFSPSFILLMLFCGYLLINQLVFPATFYGTPNFPVTYEMVRKIGESFGLVMLIIITFYSAEIVWREHNHKFQEILSVTSTPNEVFWFAKLTALCILGAIVYLMGMFLTITYQLVNGYFIIDLKQYFISLFYFDALPLLYMTVLSFLIQSVSPNKYIGMLVFIVFMVLTSLLSEIGFEHHMFRYAESPSLLYSDMNNYGWSLNTQQKYMLYWGSLALLFATVSFGLWRRGNQTSIYHRINIFAQTLGKGGRFLVICCFGLFLSMAIIIHYNTTITNEYVSSQKFEANQANYEQLYSKFIDAPKPRIIKTNLDVAMFPNKRKLQVIAELVLQNHTSKPIEKILINLPSYSHSISFDSDRGNATLDDVGLQTAWFQFDEYLMPEESFTLKIELTRQHFGFKDKDQDFGLIANGSFINNRELLPTFGVDTSSFLKEPDVRRAFGLNERNLLDKASNEAARSRSFVTKDNSVTELTINISTEIDQVALAPGEMVDYWQANNRNHFVYRTKKPVINYFNIMSADWQVYAKRFNNIDLSVHYHPTHDWNMSNMMRAMETSISAFSTRFGEYPFAQLRIVEFPRYRLFAQSFAGIIPFSEGSGFIADLRNKENVDTVFFITAHEVAHQWFGHRLNIADVEGADVLTESLAQYAALSLMQDTFGRVNLRKFMRYELDNYLVGRAIDQVQENPLIYGQQQPYLSYNKGALVMMAIAEKIGFQNLDLALHELISEFSIDSARYATVQDLINKIQKYASPEQYAFINDQFSKIVLYDLRLEDARVLGKIDDKYEIELTVFADKLRINNTGREEAVEFDADVDIVFFKDSPDKFSLDNKIIFSDVFLIKSGTQTFTILSTERPEYISVDPFIMYIDRESRDNVKAL